MAGMNFEYDERGSTFYYFLVSFYALVLIPATYYLWPRGPKKKDTGSETKSCRCQPCLIKDSLKRSKEPWKKWKQKLINVFLMLAWAGFIALAYKAAHVEVDHVEWDPYAVLGLDRGAPVDEVKKAYRQLTKIHHPDKGGDEKRFVEITKAHLSLTDEESKKNFDLYGNPDGPGAQTFGIALPSWLVSKEYSFLVLAAYGLVFMIILPTGVGIWWYRSIRYSADSVLMKTTELFAHMEHKTALLNIKRVLTILSGAYEFWKVFNKEIVERPSDDIEVNLLLKNFPSISETKREGPFFFPYSLKARALIYAHLSRMKLPPDTLNKDLHYVLKKSTHLIQEMIQVYSQLYMYAAAGRVMRTPALETLDNIMKVNPLFIQALWESKSPLLQLPHLTDEILRRFVLKKKRHIKTSAGLAALPDDERREALRGLSDRQYQDVLVVLCGMPRVEMDVTLEVKDDEDKTITAGALVTALVKLKRSPLLDPQAIGKKSTTQSQAVERRIERDSLRDYETRSDADEDDDDDGQPVERASDATGGEDRPIANVAAPPAKTKNVWEKNKKKKGAKAKAKNKPQRKKPAIKATGKKSEFPQKKDAVAAASDETAEQNERSAEDSEEDFSSDAEEAKDYVKGAKMNAIDEDNEADEDSFLLDEDFSRKEKILESKSKITHLVHCPFFPEDKYEWWWVYICDRKKRQLICPPVRVTTLVDEEEVELRFPAQHVPGIYSVQVCLRSDSYVDCDVSKDVKYSVAAAKQITSHPQWEFAEDEDKKSDEEESEGVSEYTEEDEDLSD